MKDSLLLQKYFFFFIITKPPSQVSIVSETLLYIWFSSWKVPWLMRCGRFPANATRVLNWDT